MATPPTERRQTLTELARLAVADLVQVWRRALVADVDFAQFLIEAFPEIATTYATVSADFAAEWFEQSDAASKYVATTADISQSRLVKSAEWALGGDGNVALDRMTGSMQRAVFDGARETTQLNVERTGSRWAVHARAAACPWCRMMATRGSVYKSGATALASCHDNGHCIAVEIRSGSNYEPPSYVEKWDDEYLKARANAGTGDIAAIQAAWRQVIAADN
ncbi:hypothetical protein [Mycolicibacterium conceptionense]|uniref:VG15 protein n=1 Tax=Mycolicibacterium conceptionense TaxID=451644 RepID=UPI001041C28E|nr:hypothetical protein [Mycolicibacterium conceptionense]